MHIQLKVINTFFPFINCSNLGTRTVLYKHGNPSMYESHEFESL